MTAEQASVRPLVVTWAALMALLGLTIGATFLPLGPFMPVANIGIALVKTALIGRVFMHLAELDGLVRLAAVGALAWLVILFLLTASDYLSR